jgi:hypothetical protein
MEKEFELFTAIGSKLKNAEVSQMFGKPCLKVKGKAFACFFESEMVFKLGGSDHEHALGLSGSGLFDPSGKGRPMKEWVQVTYLHKDKWPEFAKSALAYVSKG